MKQKGIGKKYRVLVIVVLLLIVIPGSGGTGFTEDRKIPKQEQVSFGGAIITREGRSIKVSEFLSPLKTYYIQGEFQDRVVKIRAADLKEIRLLDVECGYGWYFHGPQWKGRMGITDRSGEIFQIIRADFCDYNLQNGDFRYKVFNETLGKDETRSIMITRIARLLIGDVEQ